MEDTPEAKSHAIEASVLMVGAYFLQVALLDLEQHLNQSLVANGRGQRLATMKINVARIGRLEGSAIRIRTT